MSEPGQPQPQLAQAPINQMSSFPCMSCKQVVEFLLPKPEIVNKGTVSAILFAHERMPVCPHCKMPYVFLIQGMDANASLIFIWAPVQQAAPGAGLVTHAGEADVRSAAKNADKMKEMLNTMKDGKLIV